MIPPLLLNIFVRTGHTTRSCYQFDIQVPLFSPHSLSCFAADVLRVRAVLYVDWYTNIQTTAGFHFLLVYYTERNEISPSVCHEEKSENPETGGLTALDNTYHNSGLYMKADPSSLPDIYMNDWTRTGRAVYPASGQTLHIRGDHIDKYLIKLYKLQKNSRKKGNSSKGNVISSDCWCHGGVYYLQKEEGRGRRKGWEV